MKNPVLYAMSILAGLSAALGLSILNDILSPTVIGWLLVAQAAGTAAIQVWVRNQVTPLFDPRGYDGRQLVAKSVADVE